MLAAIKNYPFIYIMAFNHYLIPAIVGIACGTGSYFIAQYSAPVYQAQLADGALYQGDMENNLLHGFGRLNWPNGNQFTGEFVAGVMQGYGEYHGIDGEQYQGMFDQGIRHGSGELTRQDYHFSGLFEHGQPRRGEVTAKDFSYQGEIQNNQLNGEGRLTLTGGERYSGQFKDDQYHGQGRLELPTGGVYIGEFKLGQFDGVGTYTDREYKYIGQFQQGQLTGQGLFSGPNGERYKGQFDNWLYQGEGELRSANGNVFTGAFDQGYKHGPGELRFKDEQGQWQTRQGTWQYDEATDGDIMAGFDIAQAAELSLYQQASLLKAQTAQIKASDADATNVYFLGIAGDGSQAVFRREVQYVSQLMADKFPHLKANLTLMNSRDTYDSVPLATHTSVKLALEAIAEKMDKDKDVLFLFATSHGSQDHVFYINQPGFNLPGVSAEQLANTLNELELKKKILVVSACYSGGFIPALDDGNSVIITAASADNTSFGCADENDFTYFGRAFFEQSYSQGLDLQSAFEQATQLVSEWEQAEDFTPSNPQMHMPVTSLTWLKEWQQESETDTTFDDKSQPELEKAAQQ
ncbi:C13 family peptidase [Motilimonas pumila]|uniref:Peptidase C13 n=1 Tax=Motilimonas pumila TaxID=2303987 RepID=A0A418YJL4_9GAMM|nr:C13 family peptidase [Motilimonas pumila]RJG51172.1 peptidase C13 [Motilimonas pumila]